MHTFDITLKATTLTVTTEDPDFIINSTKIYKQFSFADKSDLLSDYLDKLNRNYVPLIVQQQDAVVDTVTNETITQQQYCNMLLEVGFMQQHLAN